MVFFNPNMEFGLKKHHFGAPTCFPKNIIDVQVGGRGDRLYCLRAILGTFWQFWEFTVKKVCQTGLPEDASQQRKRYHPSWVISETLPRVYLGPGHAGSAKYTLGRAS